MSLVTYNGITLPYTYITNFAQEAVMDEYQTDLMLTKFDITMNCVINAAYLAMLAPTFPSLSASTSAVDMMNAVRASLLQPRRALSIVFNGVELIPKVQGNKGTVDSKNGPIPQTCSVTQLGATTFLMVYHIVAHYWENLSINDKAPLTTNLQGNVVLSNKWSETADYDNLQGQTLTREGKCFIRSDNSQGLIADQIRTTMCVTGVPNGFLRDRSRYTVDPSGLALAYFMVDSEVFKMPPSPAYEARGEYYENTTKGGGKRYAQVTVGLKGSKTTSQTDMLYTCVHVCMAKIGQRTRAFGGASAAFILEEGSIRMGMYKNEVECTLRALIGVSAARTKDVYGGSSAAVAAFTGVNSETPRSTGSDTYQPSYNAYGTANILLQAAAYYDPSFAETTLNEVTGQLTFGQLVGSAGILKEP